MLQAQCILFRRYPDVLEPFKYGGYPMLLSAVTLPEDNVDDTGPHHFLGPEKAPLLQVKALTPPPKHAILVHLACNICKEAT